jgi:hypothetical protein
MQRQQHQLQTALQCSCRQPSAPQWPGRQCTPYSAKDFAPYCMRCRKKLERLRKSAQRSMHRALGTNKPEASKRSPNVSASKNGKQAHHALGCVSHVQVYLPDSCTRHGALHGILQNPSRSELCDTTAYTSREFTSIPVPCSLRDDFLPSLYCCTYDFFVMQLKPNSVPGSIV